MKIYIFYILLLIFPINVFSILFRDNNIFLHIKTNKMKISYKLPEEILPFVGISSPDEKVKDLKYIYWFDKLNQVVYKILKKLILIQDESSETRRKRFNILFKDFNKLASDINDRIISFIKNEDSKILDLSGLFRDYKNNIWLLSTFFRNLLVSIWIIPIVNKLNTIFKNNNINRTILGLNLSKNKISRIPPNIYSLNLRYLNLNDNKIRTINKALANLVELRVLDIRNNPLNDDLDSEWIPNNLRYLISNRLHVNADILSKIKKNFIILTRYFIEDRTIELLID